MEIVALFRTEFLIAGIAPCGENDIVLLAYQRDEDDGMSCVVLQERGSEVCVCTCVCCIVLCV